MYEVDRREVTKRITKNILADCNTLIDFAGISKVSGLMVYNFAGRLSNHSNV
jgi:hypothetical protein